MRKLPGSKKSKEYQRLTMAVGLLLISFSNVEGAFQAALKLHLTRHLKGRDDEHFPLSLTSAIYGSMRFSHARDTMKRIMGVEKTPKQHLEFAADIFQQMGNVQSLRDMLAHQHFISATGSDSDEWTLSDVFTTKDSMNPKTYHVNTEAIEMAAIDATELCTRLTSFQETSTLFSGGDVSIIPWLYKPSMLRLLP